MLCTAGSLSCAGARKSFVWWSWSSGRSLDRFGEALEASKPVAVAARHRVAHHERIPDPAEAPGQLVFITHAHARAAGCRLHLPALHAAHAVRILKTPLEHAAPVMLRDHGREAHLAAPHASRDAHLKASLKVRRAALHFEFGVHFRAVPIGHPLRHEKNGDASRRRLNFHGELQFGHGQRATLPRVLGAPRQPQQNSNGENYYYGAGTAIAEAPSTRRLLRSWRKTTARRFSRFHSGASFSSSWRMKAGSARTNACPMSSNCRTTAAWSRLRPAFSPARTSEWSLLSVIARNTSIASPGVTPGSASARTSSEIPGLPGSCFQA